MLGKIIWFFSLLIFDFLSKLLIVHHLPEMYSFPFYPYGGIGLLHSAPLTVSIVHATNTGAAWGVLADWKLLLLSVRIIICIGLFVYLCFWNSPKIIQIPLIGILAGALGNILDFALYGHVIDMIYCIFFKYSYPVFNVADSTIFCSVCYLLFLSMRKKIGISDHAISSKN